MIAVSAQNQAARHGDRCGRQIDKPAPFAGYEIELLACEKRENVDGRVAGAKKRQDTTLMLERSPGAPVLLVASRTTRETGL